MHRASHPILLAIVLSCCWPPASAATHAVATVAQLDSAISAARAGDEIVLAAGTYRLSRTIAMDTAGVTIRGATGRREDVVLVGGGMNTRGVDEGITVGADDVVIRDLTLRDFYHNAIHTRAEAGADRCRIANVRTWNIGERHIKGSRDPARSTVSEGMVIERVHLLQTMARSGHPDTHADYIGGMDIMCARGLVIRDCLAEGIRGANDGGNAAIFLWQGIEDPVIERCRIHGCAKGIAIGNPALPGESLPTGRWHGIGGVIRSNTIVRGPWTGGNHIALELCSVKDVRVLGNTISSADATYFRTVSLLDCESDVGRIAGVAFAGNLIRGRIHDFTDGSGWTLAASNLVDGSGGTVLPAWFIDHDGGDLHLSQAATGAIGTAPRIDGLDDDLDGEPRRVPGSLGADQPASAVDDAARANGWDAGWRDRWVAHCRSLHRTAGKTEGFVLHLGDSITHANPYGQWPRRGAGPTASDRATIAWFGGDRPFPGGTADADSEHGLYLAAADTTAIRGMTAASGLSAAEFRGGGGNGGTAMPAVVDPVAARATVADPAYARDLHVATVAAAFSRAQVAVLMLGTNDVGAGRDPVAFAADLTALVLALEERGIVPVLSTIPPHPTDHARARSCNEAIRALCRDRGLPLIDYHREILARRPGTSWNGTLLAPDDVHPSATGGGHDAASDPYAAGGDAASHRTGAACTHSGYLLRSWLTVQKLKQVRELIAGAAPRITAGPTVHAQPVTGTTATLQVAAEDPDGDDAALVYAWSAPSRPTGATAPTFSPDGATAAARTTATFHRAGSYTLQVTVTDGDGLQTSAAIDVTVQQTAERVEVAP